MSRRTYSAPYVKGLRTRLWRALRAQRLWYRAPGKTPLELPPAEVTRRRKAAARLLWEIVQLDGPSDNAPSLRDMAVRAAELLGCLPFPEDATSPDDIPF